MAWAFVGTKSDGRIDNFRLARDTSKIALPLSIISVIN